MLFISEEIVKARGRLLHQLEEHRITEEQACQQALELDPADFFVLRWLGRVRQNSGDLSGAEQSLCQAIEANPWEWGCYIDLAQLHPEQPALHAGLSELACRKLSLNDKAIDREDAEPFLRAMRSFVDSEDLSKPELLELFAEAMMERREEEPEEVTARLLPYRLIHLLHSSESLDKWIVDEMIEQGASFVPLLVGTLRGWAVARAPADTESMVENALGLLGEIGDPAAIPALLEFLSVDDFNLAATAEWALDRIVILHPAEAALAIERFIPGLDSANRIAVTNLLALHPSLDPDGRLMNSVGESLGQMPKELLEPLATMLVASMILARGRAGVEVARAWLQRHRGILPHKTWRRCERQIADMGRGADFQGLLPAEPSPWTVYDICAGEAVWDDLEDEDDLDDEMDEEEYLDYEHLLDESAPFVSEPMPPRLLQIPFSRPFPYNERPGRNDPCWCGSGKKYKKCHLDKDQGGDPPPTYVN